MAKNLKPIGLMGISRNLAALFAALTGALVVWSIAYYSILSTFDNPLAAAIGSFIAVVAVLAIIDLGLRQYLPYGLYLAFSGQAWKDWRKSTFFILLMGIVIFQAFSSMSLSWMGRVDMTDAILQGPSVTDVSKVTEQQSAHTTTLLASLDADIAALQDDISSAKKNAMANSKSNLAVIAAKKDTWGWHQKQIDKRVNNATRGIRKQLEQKMKTKDQMIAQQAVNSSSIIASVTENNHQAVENYNMKRNRNMKYLGFFGVSCTFVFIILSIMIALDDDYEETETEMKPRRKKKVAKTPKVSSGEDVSDSNHHSNTDWFLDDSTGYKFRVSGPNIMVESFSGWFDYRQAKKKMQQYENHLQNGKGTDETNSKNIEKFKRAMEILEVNNMAMA